MILFSFIKLNILIVVQTEHKKKKTASSHLKASREESAYKNYLTFMHLELPPDQTRSYLIQQNKY